MKRLIVPEGGAPGDARCVPWMRNLLAFRGYDATLQEAFDMHVWLAKWRQVESDLLLSGPITDEEFDTALFAGVIRLEA